MVIIDYDDRRTRRHPQLTPAEALEVEEEQERYDNMEVSQRSKVGGFSNFSSLPCFNVQWGRRKHLRCVKEDYNAGDGDGVGESLTRSVLNLERKRRSNDDDDGGIKAMGEKLVLDFRAEVHQMQADFFKKSDVAALTAVVEPMPWNLRTRRAVCKEPNNLPISGNRKPSFSPAKQSEGKSPARRSNGEVNGGERPRPKFSGSLSKQEIEEDFMAMLGTRPARRPKKRPKNVQKQIDAVFPGFWLSEITPDMYKVNEQSQPADLRKK